MCGLSWSGLKSVYILTWITNPKNSILILIPPSEVQETRSLKSKLSTCVLQEIREDGKYIHLFYSSYLHYNKPS